MLEPMERKLLQFLGERQILTKAEIYQHLGSDQLAEKAIQTLKQEGYISNVESLGTSVVITQKGTRLLNNSF